MKLINLAFAGLIACFGFVQAVSAQQVTGVSVYSPAMDKEVPNIVITPSGYAESGIEYPVVYLLHGAGGDFTAWMSIRPDLPEFADCYEMIIVCPDGGSTSWYFDSPVDPAMRYETYIAEELVDFIDSNFRTIEDEDARAITGYSMGGHGAFYISFRNPDVFGAAGSTSGGMDIRPFPGGWDLDLRLGDPSGFPQHWESHTVINLVDDLNGAAPELIFDCGTEDFFFGVNEALAAELEGSGIPHTYSVRPGGHSAEYWMESLADHLSFFDAFFDDGREE